MFIKKITIANLFAYFGEQSVEFRREEGKNLYCIYGENGFGKTSFIRAAKLLFLGAGILEGEIPKPIGRFCDKSLTPKQFVVGLPKLEWKGILNQKAAQSDDAAEFFVEFCGELEGVDFRLKRSFEKNGEGEKLVLEISGARLENRFENLAAQEKINAILPPNLVEFFFFDGEDLVHLAENLRSELREKMEEILVVKPLDSLLRQAQIVENELIANEAKNAEQKREMGTMRRLKEEKEEALEAAKNEVANLNLSLENNEAKKDKLRREMERLEAKTSREREDLIAAKNDLEGRVAGARESLKDSLKSVVFASNWELIETLKTELDSLEKSQNEGDIEVFRNFLGDLSDFLSTELDLEKQRARILLEKFQASLENKHLPNSQITRIAARGLREIIARAGRANLGDEVSKMKHLKSDLGAVKADLDSQDLDDYTRDESTRLKAEISEVEAEIAQEKAAFAAAIGKEKELEAAIREQDSRIYHLEQGINTERIDGKLALLRSLKNIVESYKQRLIERLKDELHGEILKNYHRLLPNDNVRELEIDERFAIKLKDEDGGVVAIESQSSGQKQILAIAIFWALSRLSKSNLPLIIDTPLSRIDAKNRARIIQNYYAHARQVIILPHTGEMGRREYDYAKPNLAGLFRICNEHNRKEASIKIARIDEIL